MASDSTVFVGSARREDGTPEPNSAHLGFKPDQDDASDHVPEPDRDHFDPASMAGRSGPYDPDDEATSSDILAVCKLASDRLAWIQKFLLWSVYGVPLVVLTLISLPGVLSGSEVSGFFLVIAVICIAVLVTLLQSIHPTFAPAKKPFRPIRVDDEDLDRLRQRIESRRRARRSRR